MSRELRIDKFCTGVAFTYETKEKLMLKYALPGEKFPAVVRRLCEGLVKDVKLPKSITDEIERKKRANLDKRLAARDERSKKRKGVQSVRNIKKF